MRMFHSIAQFLPASLLLVLPLATFGQSPQVDSSTAAHVRAEAQQAQQATPPKATTHQPPMQARASAPAPSSQPNQPPTMQPQVPTPEAPLRPAQMPPSPPRVSYVGGQLTVTASNSTFSDVLVAVRNASGIRIEGIGLTGGDRVFGQFGPGSPRDVLGFLLTGAHFDFIILGTIEDPNAAQKLILSPRMGPAQTGAQSAGVAPARPGLRSPANDDNDTDNQQADVADEQPATVQPPPAQPSLAQPSPVQQTGSAQPANPQQNNGVKTPEQLLEEMRRLNNRGNGNAQSPPQPTQPNLQPNMPPDTVPR
jgi:hypothetical protein